VNPPLLIAGKEYFPGIGRIAYEGPESDNPLAFKVYDAGRKIGDKTMAEHLKFAVCYWHTFTNAGHDPFGPGTRRFPWDCADPMASAEARMDAAFEFFTKLGVPYYCFHDVDMSPDADDIGQYERNLRHMVKLAKERQQASGMKLLWGTANLFGHPRYMNGAATNPDFNVVARAAVQVKNALDATVELGGEHYVFWGGREGYASLHNTDMKRETEHLARFLEMARDYGRSIGFKGYYLIEPKPMEPMKHQYDFDSGTVVGFLKMHGLADDFKLNIEANHATLSGHTFEHDLQVASDHGMLGSIDANCGNPQNGWDTDQFPSSLYDTVAAMLVVLRQGGLVGGLNFDATIWTICSSPISAAWMHLHADLKSRMRSSPARPGNSGAKRAIPALMTARARHLKTVKWILQNCVNMPPGMRDCSRFQESRSNMKTCSISIFCARHEISSILTGTAYESGRPGKRKYPADRPRQCGGNHRWISVRI